MAPDEQKRAIERLRAHYVVERELADRLRAAPPHERSGLYVTVYDELFRRVPDHPQWTRRRTPEEQAARIARQADRLLPFLAPGGVFLEIGCGDGALSRRMARHAREVIAVDVSDVISRSQDPLPDNLRVIVTNGTGLPLPDDRIDLAYSHQLMEHLHPDDAMAQLQEIHRTLAPGGVYLCVTPHRASGPHDISGLFDEVATGLHLKEYAIGELAGLFSAAGFCNPTLQVELRGWSGLWPLWPGLACERTLNLLPHALRRKLAGTFPLRNLLGIRLVAFKSRVERGA
ncbi:MAG: class I SAM-dependent methyltransferase [Magnetococcales bacterium]|nr:class I SAM-dependent methyltransferase [Magnetococcales bacterium]